MATYVILSRVSPEAFREPKGFKKLADEPEEEEDWDEEEEEQEEENEEEEDEEDEEKINSNALKDHPGQIDPVS